MLGLVCSAAATLESDQIVARVLSGIAALCVATLGLTKPDQIYYRFVRAWRILDNAAALHKYGELSTRELLEKMGAAEETLGRLEELANQPQKDKGRKIQRNS